MKYKFKYHLDEAERTILHREIILKKTFLKKIYEEWYGILIKRSKDTPEGKLLEIGSGGGFLKDIATKLITSDIQKLDNCDFCFSAEHLPFKENTLSAVFMILN